MLCATCRTQLCFFHEQLQPILVLTSPLPRKCLFIKLVCSQPDCKGLQSRKGILLEVSLRQCTALSIFLVRYVCMPSHVIVECCLTMLLHYDCWRVTDTV